MVFDELQVNVGANTADFNQGMDSAERSLNAFDRAAIQAASNANILGESIDEVASDALQAAGSMQFLASRTDSVGDEMTETAVQSTATSASLSQLSTSGGLASTSMLSLSTVLSLSLLPAIVTVGAALVPVVAALGGFVAAAGAITGVGLAATIGAIMVNTKELRAELNELLGTIGDEFSFAIEMATDVLITWLDQITALIPQLVPARSTIRDLAASFQAVGSALIGLLPELTDLAVTLAQDFLPGMVRLAEEVLPEVPGFIRSLVSVFQRLIPSFERAGNLLVSLAPQLLEFGFAAFNVVAPALEQITLAVGDFLSAFNNLSSTLKSIILSAATITPILAGLAAILGGPITIALAAVVSAAIVFRDELLSIFTTVGNAASTLQESLTQALSNNAFNLDNLENSLVSLGRQTREVATVWQSFLSRVFSRVGRIISENQKTIRNFGRVVVNAFAGIIDVVRIMQRLFLQTFTTVIEPVVMSALDVLGNRFGPVVTEISQTISHFANVLNDVGNALAFAESGVNSLMPVINAFVDLLSFAVNTALDTVLTSLTVVANILQGDFTAAWNDITGLVNRNTNRMVTLIQKWGLVSAFTGTVDSIVNAFTSLWTVQIPGLFITGMGALLGNARVALDQLQNRFAISFNNIAQTIANIMEDVVNNVIDGLNFAIGEIQNVISDLPSDVREQLPGFIQNLDQLGQFEAGQVSPIETAQPQPIAERAAATRELAVSLGVDIQGDGELAQLIRENSEIVVQQRERRADRMNNRGSGV